MEMMTDNIRVYNCNTADERIKEYQSKNISYHLSSFHQQLFISINLSQNCSWKNILNIHQLHISNLPAKNLTKTNNNINEKPSGHSSYLKHPSFARATAKVPNSLTICS